MTDTSTNDNSDNENHEQQEIESYLHSLVHHGCLEEECQQEADVIALSQGDVGDSTPAEQKTWRYFNATPERDKDQCSKRVYQSREQYNCNYNRTTSPKLLKSFFWRRPFSKPVVHYNRVGTMENNKEKTIENPPQLKSLNNANSEGVSEIVCIDGVEKKDIHEEQCAPSSSENICQAIAKASSSLDVTIVKVHPNSSPSKENVERTSDNIMQVLTQDNVEVIDELNNTNPSLSSFDDCFEPPSTPKSKSSLNESMTQVLQVMLDEDASRSSIDSSDKRPVQKSKVPSKPSSGTGWTVGMSWEDMSSKFRFNFEVDSVCGDSVRDSSVSASSRANTPEGVSTSPQDVSKYDLSLKAKNNTADVVNMEVDNSDSEGDSVIEISKPVKEPPPVVEILSDSEDTIPSKIKKPDEPQEIEEDIIILYETVPAVENCAEDNISQVVSNPLPMKPTNASRPTKKKERQKKRAKQSKFPVSEESDHGLGNILAKMSDDPNLWRISREDIYPRPAARRFPPCVNCKQRDHLTWRCPEPVKIKVCALCAEPGHLHFRCPSRMCLNCGISAPQFVRNCRACSKKVCDICSWSGHETPNCPDLWRRYHMTTSKGPPVEPPSDFKVRPPTEMWCCNCATKGHISDMCPLKPSPINEKRLSYVVSYTDPSRGKGTQAVANLSFEPRNQASSSKPCLQANARATPKQPLPPNPPDRLNRVEQPRAALPNFCNTPEFINNYKQFRPKLRCIGQFPADSSALAKFLESQLDLLKKPVLNDAKVRIYFGKLMTLMKQDRFSKTSLRKALLYASKINMTVLGFGGMAEGNDLVNDLRSKIEELRFSRTGRVSTKERHLINVPFTQLFKGSIRNDLNALINEYLKRRKRASS